MYLLNAMATILQPCQSICNWPKQLGQFAWICCEEKLTHPYTHDEGKGVCQ